MTEQIPAEAVEAASEAAYQVYVSDAGQTLATRDLTNAITDAALAAALVVLAQPARVVPGVEDVRKVLAETDHRMDGSTPWETVFAAQAQAVLALFASQPTVAEVREQALSEIRKACVVGNWDVHEWGERGTPFSNGADKAFGLIYNLIARGETKGDDRG